MEQSIAHNSLWTLTLLVLLESFCREELDLVDVTKLVVIFFIWVFVKWLDCYGLLVFWLEHERHLWRCISMSRVLNTLAGSRFDSSDTVE